MQTLGSILGSFKRMDRAEREFVLIAVDKSPAVVMGSLSIFSGMNWRRQWIFAGGALALIAEWRVIRMSLVSSWGVACDSKVRRYHEFGV